MQFLFTKELIKSKIMFARNAYYFYMWYIDLIIKNIIVYQTWSYQLAFLLKYLLALFTQVKRVIAEYSYFWRKIFWCLDVMTPMQSRKSRWIWRICAQTNSYFGHKQIFLIRI